MNETVSYEEQIFLEAVAIDSGAAREAFLQEACGEDRQLQLRIEGMIAIHGYKDGVLEKTSHSSFAPIESKDPIQTGTTIGPYKLLQQIGAGGMGVVFMAQQENPVRRKVAIKVIRHGMDSKNVIARFEAERQALAIMNHPNISRIYDAGVTESGRPYFVMELITGLPITRFCDQRKLSLRKRLELFQKVCHAVQHAHQKGVIHRDIKPSNIMVTQIDGSFSPKIIDFGIAKAINQPLTEKTLFTSYGNMVGTPEYMSPEQAELNGLDVDTCSDVYSLGVVLYELMTGTTPFYEFKDSGLRQFCDAICTEEPELASTRVNKLTDTHNQVSRDRNIDGRELRQFLRGDVDWILAKCLAKRREDRYATVADLATDIHRHLHGEPVLAAAPSKSYRIRKFLTRHRLASSTVAILAASMLITTLVSFAFATRAIKAEKLANSRLQETEVAQRQAENERDRALAAEAKLRELERRSRLEAANAQALVRFINHSNDMDGVHEFESQNDVGLSKEFDFVECRDWLAESSNQIGISDTGNMFLAKDDEAFNIEFPNGVDIETAKDYQIHVKAIGRENRKCAEQVLVMVSDELEKRFGDSDLFLVEPKMKLAEIFMENEDWQEAEQELRETSSILKSNLVDSTLQGRNVLMLALSLAKQERYQEAQKLIEDNINAIQLSEEETRTLREARQEMRETIEKAKKKFGNQIGKVSACLFGIRFEIPRNIWLEPIQSNAD